MTRGIDPDGSSPILPHKSGNRGGADDPPPIGKSWRQVYTVVLLWLGVLIVLFYVFTRTFS